jgi:hypothetical protein
MNEERKTKVFKNFQKTLARLKLYFCTRFRNKPSSTREEEHRSRHIGLTAKRDLRQRIESNRTEI